MRLEIHHETGRKEVVNFTKDKAVVGNGENSDIIIEGEHVGRNQLILEKIDGKIFVTDLDTPHGTYINDTLIEPHQKIEFLSFFPIQIGPKVLIYLLQDEDVAPVFNFDKKENLDKTSKSASSSVAELDELLAGGEKKKTTDKRGTPSNVPSAAKMAKEKAQNRNMMISGAVAVAIALGIAYKISQDIEHTEMQNVNAKDPYTLTQEKIAKTSNNDLFRAISRTKCVNETDQKLCTMLKIPFNDDEGVFLLNGKVYITINMDRSMVTNLKDELATITNQYRQLYILLKLFSNQEFWMELEKMGLSRVQLFNMLLIQGVPTISSTIEISREDLLSKISMEDMNMLLHALKSRTEEELIKKIDVSVFNLVESNMPVQQTAE